MTPFQDRDIGGHPHRKGGHEDVAPDQPGELEARQQNRIEIHDNLAEPSQDIFTQIGGGSGAPVYRSHTISNVQGC